MLSAHDKGTHAEVQVKVRKVFDSGQTELSLGTSSIYPLSWTKHGCTCPVLNPGKTTTSHGNTDSTASCYYSKEKNRDYRISNSDTRYGIPAGRLRGGWDGTVAGHHAKCGGPMDTQDQPAGIRGPEERMPVNSKKRDSAKDPTSQGNAMEHL